MAWGGRGFAGAVVAAAALLFGCKGGTKASVELQPAQVVVAAKPAAESPHIGGCPVFPPDNVWNTPVDDLPKDPHSDTYIDTMGVLERLHADFGTNSGIPVTVINKDEPRTKIHFQYQDESDDVGYPLPSDVAIEGGPHGYGDRHVLVVDSRDCMLYEIWHWDPHPDGRLFAGSGVKMDLRSNALRQDGWTSADAAGLAILPGLVRYDEVASGEIRHAIRFTLPQIRHAYVWPGRHYAFKDTNPDLLPYGARLRLRKDFDVSLYTGANRVIVMALKRYGMILADGGSAIYITGEPDARWDDDLLSQLKTVRGQDFEVVDESGLQVGKDSGAAKQRR